MPAVAPLICFDKDLLNGAYASLVYVGRDNIPYFFIGEGADAGDALDVLSNSVSYFEFTRREGTGALDGFTHFSDQVSP